MYEVKSNGVTVNITPSYEEACQHYEQVSSSKKQLLHHIGAFKSVIQEQLHQFRSNKVVPVNAIFVVQTK